MLNLKTKKVVAAVVAVAFVLSLVGGVVSSASADVMTTTTTSTTVAGYTFNTNLTVGSTGADVVALQSILVANGFLVMPAGVSMGYFGGLTKSALGAWQASVGISPTAGYFGPITRAYFNSHTMTGSSTTTTSTSTVPGCSSTAGFSPTTGQSCAGSASTVPGCTSTVGYSPTTGQSCSGSTTTTTTTSSTGEGTLTITQGPPGSNSNIQQNVDVPVYGLQLRAQLGDVRVDRIDLDVMDQISGSNQIENPGNFINNIKIMDGSTVLLNRSVGTSDFITGTSSTDYYMRLSGLGFMVPNGSTKVLTVTFSTSGSIDSNRTLTIRGYGASSLLSYSGVNNTASYYDISNQITTQIFQKPGNSTVITGIDQSNPLSMTNYVDVNNGSQAVPLIAFNTNTTQGSSRVTQVVASVRTGLETSTYSSVTGATTTYSAASVFPTGAHLFQGAQELQYRPITSGSQTVTFDNLDLSSQGSGNVYTIKVDMPANTANGTVASGTVSSVTYKNSNGNQQTSTSTVNGNNQYFFHATPQLAFTSADYVKTSNTSGSTTAVQVNFHFTLTPYPGQAAVPTASDFAVLAQNGNTGGVSPLILSKGITISPNPTNGVLGPQTYSVTLTANDTTSAPGTYVYKVTAASSTVQDSNGNYINVIQTWGFDNWHTDPVSRT